ncbi:MAG TPA: hypothetical protein ENL40_07335 [Thermococcus litoralis]|uniref:Potassium channel domain-containing protein n=1 Tax=Thermococcus litoralis TaxID=2265 RepID=A0A7C5JXN8_THELI|nr:hypothetical protein [Thermococcus litoralis]
MCKDERDIEETIEFYRKFLERFNPSVEEIEVSGQKITRLVFEEYVDARNVVFPSLFGNEEMNLEYCDPKTGLKWAGKFPFKHAVFKKGASFSEATFEGVVSFYGAIFEDDADFYKTTFEWYVSFDRVVFKGIAHFGEAKFKNDQDIFDPQNIGQQWRFQKEVSPEVRTGHVNPSKPSTQRINEFYRFSVTFINAEFMNRVSFNNAKFYGAVRFNFSKFGTNVERKSPAPIDFEKVKFLGPSTEFVECTFSAETSFSDTEFYGHANFEGSTFEQSSYFDRSEFLVDVNPKDTVYFGPGFSPINFRKTNFKKDVSFRGVEFYSKPRFFRTHFEGSAAFTRDMGATTKECAFHQGVEFIMCVFEKEVDFQNCIFRKPNITVISPNYKYPGTSFARSRFGGSAHFNFARFGKVVLNFARFLGQVGFVGTEFSGHLHIREAVFEDIVSFSSAKFNDVDIEGSRFHGAVIFSGSTLNGKFRLYHSTFEREVLFGKGGYKEEDYSPLKFSQGEHPVILEWVVFDDHVSFTEITFLPPVEIIGCKFNGYVSFENAIFKNDAKFDYCLVNGSVSFVGKQNEECKFFKTLTFDGVSLSGTVSFVKSNRDNELEEEFKSMFRLSQALIEAVRIQRLSFEHEGKRDEADRMFVLKMRTRRRLRLEQAREDSWRLFETKTRNFIEWLLGDLPSEYGTSLERIAWAVLIVVILFGVLYWLTLMSNALGMAATFVIISLLISIWHHQTFDNYPDRLAETLKFPVGMIIILGMFYWSVAPQIKGVIARPDILLSNGTSIAHRGINSNCIGTLLNALYYSLVTFTTLGYGDMHPTGWLKALSAIEALTGAVFMALIVAVIARKWMR